MKRKSVVLNRKYVQKGKHLFSQTIKKLQKEKEKLPLNSPGHRVLSNFVAGLIRRRCDLKECERVGSVLL